MTRLLRQSWRRRLSAAARSGVFAALLAAGAALWPDSAAAQKGGGSVSLAEAELERRRAVMEEAMQQLHEGDLFRERGELDAALSSYRDALDAMPDAPATRQLRADAGRRYAETAVRRARELAAEGRYAEAEALVDAVLLPEYDPTYRPAIELKAQLQDDGYFNRALTPEHIEAVAAVNKMLVMADGLMQLGKFEDASLKYADVLGIDPYNAKARQGMEAASRAISQYLDSARDHTRADMLRAVDEMWEREPEFSAEVELEMGPGTDALPISGLESTANKLRAIVLPRVEFLDAELREVIDWLVMRTRDLDVSAPSPESRGVNIVLQDPGGAEALGSRRLSLSLTNVPLSEVLRYVTDQTGTIYVTEPFAVRILPRGEGTAATMRAQTFRVPPNFIASSSAGGADEPLDPFAQDAAPESGLQITRMSAREFLLANGITFPEGASAQFIPGSSTLVVRNTEENLAVIQNMVEAAFVAGPRQVRIKVVMLESTTRHLTELGYDWLLGQFNVPGSERVFGSGGTFGNQGLLPEQIESLSLVDPIAAATAAGQVVSAEYPFNPPQNNAGAGAVPVPVGQFPVTAGNRSGFQLGELTDSIDDVLVKSNEATIGIKAPGVFGIAGVMTDPQFQTVLRALNQKHGIEVASAPSIVTRSGQRATVDVVREFPYPTEFEPPEIPQDFVTFNGGAGGSAPVIPAFPSAFEVRELGRSLEVEPVIGPDGFTVQVSLTAEFDEFEGFIDYGQPISSGQVVLSDNEILQPVFRKVSENTSVTVFDGATIVIGGLLGQEYTQTADKTPFLGDIPLFGRLFRSQITDVHTKAVIFMIKVEIIDPTGRSLR